MKVAVAPQAPPYRSFFLLRHGVTAWNMSGRLQGRTDIALSAEGRMQLQRLRVPARFKRLPWYTSPMLRARETAVALGMTDYQIVAPLIEMHWGDWEGQTVVGLRADLGEVMQRNEAAGLDFRPPRGESPREVGARVVSWMEQNDARDAEHASVVVTHKGVIRAVLATAWQWDMLGKPPVKLAWHCLHEVRLHARGTLSAGELNIPMCG